MTTHMKRTYLVAVVLTLCLVACAGDEPKISATFNQNASLSGELPANPFQWRVITSAIDSADSTMSTLYGNDVAVQYARTDTRHEYPTGSVLSLVKWAQRDDGRYFGAKIPDDVKSVEFVFIGPSADARSAYSYQVYEGKPLKRVIAQEGPNPTSRAAYLLSQQAAVMP